MEKLIEKHGKGLVNEDMLVSYLETALWSSCHYKDDDDCGEPFDSFCDINDLAEETIIESIKDLSDFMSQVMDAELSFEDMPSSYIGHNYWLNRVGHGAGFWDTDLNDGNKISDICKYNRVESCYLGDDDKVYIA